MEVVISLVTSFGIVCGIDILNNVWENILK